MKGDFAVGLTIIGFSLFYLFFANQIPQAGSAATVGPRAFPFGIGIMMLLSGIWLALGARRAQAQGVVSTLASLYRSRQVFIEQPTGRQ